jgi:hypothetical protein
MDRYFGDQTDQPSKALRAYLVLIGCAERRENLTYGQLCERINVPDRRQIGRILGHIAYWCHDNGLPNLNVLAVNQDTGEPSDGYPGDQDFAAQREQVFATDWSAILPPTPDELKQAFDYYNTGA